MSESLWLPPLNSHDDFTFKINLNNDDNGHSDLPICRPESILLRLTSCVYFYSDEYEDVNTGYSFCGISIRNDIRVPTTSIGSGISSILANKALVPFELPLELKGCYYNDYRVNRRPQNDMKCRFYSKRDLIERITNYLQNLLVTVPHVSMVIKKIILLPKDEFDAWVAWSDEQSERRPGIFEEEYEQAICRLRTERELWQESITRSWYKSTHELFIYALEEVLVLHSKQCSVCLEEIPCGQSGLRMPCMHEFHNNCIIRWLKTSHMCPLCRYVLPTAS